MTKRAEAAGFSATIDLDHAKPGETFQATWTFRNSGTSHWNGRHSFAYTSQTHPETANYPQSALGAQPASLKSLGFTKVKPNETAALTITFTAPPQPGTYATNWQLQRPNGRPFGPIRWMRIVVEQSSDPISAKPYAYQSLKFENSVQDFNHMQPGQQFTATWTMRNSGAAPWSGDFRVTYVDEAVPETQQMVGDRMGSPDFFTLRQLTGREEVQPGETIAVQLDLVAPTQPGAYAYHWKLRTKNGRAIGGVNWLQIGVMHTDIIPPLDPASHTTAFGMNMNPNQGLPLDVEQLRGLKWVRYVYWASREKNSPEQAYQKRYRHIIQSYANAGIKSLLVLHQDTEGGNWPWSNGGWSEYANTFARACGQVAKACLEFRHMVAYQIFNETDSGFGADAPYANPSAVSITPERFAEIVDKSVKAIRAVDPEATIVLGGMKTGPHNAVNYLNIVKQELGGHIPVDALACHPYGRYVNHAPFNYKEIGRLADALHVYKTAFPKLPLWITEIGTPGHDTVLGPEYYETIAKYMREVINEVADHHADHVPVLIWFAWSDWMENAGMITREGVMKAHIEDAFNLMKQRSQASAPAAMAFNLVENSDSEFVSFFTTLTNHNAVPAGSTFTNRWTFKNSGNTSWGDGFQLVYSPADGTQNNVMMAKTSYELADVASPLPAKPGAEVVVELNMTAPDQPGRRYTSRWEMRDPDGDAFGHLYAEITVVPAPTVGTSVRQPGMTFLKDQTVADGTRYVVGSDFDKQWLVRNSGSRNWSSGFRLVYIQGDLQMARGATTHIVPDAKPGESVILSVPMTAPPTSNGQPTAYSSLWRMQDDRGNLFGDPIWAKIKSITAVPVTPTQDTALTRLLNDPTMWYSQLDPAWANDQLGFGPATIGTWGCLLTCMAMGLTAHGTPITPKVLNQQLKAKGDRGFSGSVVFFNAPSLIGGLHQKRNLRSWQHTNLSYTEWTGEDPIQRIDNELTAGNIVLAQVDTKPNNGFYNSNNEQHWVILVKRTPEGDDYLMLDPITRHEQLNTQPRSLMAKYGNPIPSRSNEENLRNAILSTLVYYKPGGLGG